MNPTQDSQASDAAQATENKGIAPGPQQDAAASRQGQKRSKSRRQRQNKVAAHSVQVELRNADVEEIRAVLALKPAKQSGLSAKVWMAIAAIILLTSVAIWRWTAARERAAEASVPPPQVTMPKPPDFALDTPVYTVAASQTPSASHPRHSRGTRGAGN
jgi:hypothetical protein